MYMFNFFLPAIKRIDYRKVRLYRGRHTKATVIVQERGSGGLN